jgi:hypothetical protein
MPLLLSVDTNCCTLATIKHGIALDQPGRAMTTEVWGRASVTCHHCARRHLSRSALLLTAADDRNDARRAVLKLQVVETSSVPWLQMNSSEGAACKPRHQETFDVIADVIVPYMTPFNHSLVGQTATLRRRFRKRSLTRKRSCLEICTLNAVRVIAMGRCVVVIIQQHIQPDVYSKALRDTEDLTGVHQPIWVSRNDRDNNERCDIKNVIEISQLNNIHTCCTASQELQLCLQPALLHVCWHPAQHICLVPAGGGDGWGYSSSGNNAAKLLVFATIAVVAALRSCSCWWFDGSRGAGCRGGGGGSQHCCLLPVLSSMGQLHCQCCPRVECCPKPQPRLQLHPIPSPSSSS